MKGNELKTREFNRGGMPVKRQGDVASGGREKELLDAYVRLVQKWNPVARLVSSRDVNYIEERHFPDCMAVLPLLPEAGRHLDLGSGAGLPGIPIAIARPSLDVILLERNQRKSAFLVQAKLELDLANVEVVCSDAREVEKERRFDTITARAVASPARAWKLAKPFLEVSGRLLLHNTGVSSSLFKGGIVLETRSAGRGYVSVVGLEAREWER